MSSHGNPQKKALTIALRIGTLFGTTLLAVLIGLYGAIFILVHGPSKEAKRVFVLSTNETSAAKFVPYLVLPKKQVKAILDQAGTDSLDGDVDSSLIEMEPPKQEDAPKEIEVLDIKKTSFKGKLMIIKDPSKVYVGTLNAYGEQARGLTLYQFIEQNGAIAGTNAGGFYDLNGSGNGGIPDGLVIANGKIAWGSADKNYNNVIGFDKKNILHVGNMSGQKALDLGLVSAVCFPVGPVLVQNGVPTNSDRDLGGGMNPRTSIGQRADGAVLLLVVEGRRIDSLGATYDDLADLMMEYGAVNAANLDGGSSTLMVYEGKALNESSSLVGTRGLPTAILVKP